MGKRGSKREAAQAIVARLREAGHVALFAGGCVRDLLTNVEPKDYDVATDAVPERVCQLFPRTQKVGAQFGVVIVRMKGQTVEVATFRSDGDYADGRHPSSVHYSDPVQDAQRRDFTINGMYFDPLEDRVIDQVGGMEDLRNRVVRAIGDPVQRFGEDHLRMLRGVRFAARLSFELEAKTAAAIRESAERIRDISAERIRAELLMILQSPTRRRGWDLLHELGLSAWIVRDTSWTDAEAADVSARLGLLPEGCSDALLLAVLFRKYTPREAVARWRALTCSNAQIAEAVWLLQELPRVLGCATFELADFKLLMAWSWCDNLLHLMRAEVRGRALPEEPLQVWERRTAGIRPEEISPPLFVTGDDLTRLGLPSGPAFARLLARLYRAQLNGELADREAALRLAEELVKAEPT
jgi:tRNA nucleotidyltransferase/poly(A) polymerase